MSSWVWTTDVAASDLSFGGTELFNKKMLQVPTGSGTFVVTVPFGASEAGFLYSPPGEPGNAVWPVGAWSVGVFVSVANANISLEVGLARLTAAGTFVETYDSLTSGPISLGTTGLKTFGGSTRAQTGTPAPSSTDRLRVLLRFTRSGAKGVGTVTLGYGDGTRDLISVPVEIVVVVPATPIVPVGVIYSRLVGSMVVQDPSTPSLSYVIAPHVKAHVLTEDNKAFSLDGSPFFLYPTHGSRVTRVGTPYYDTVLTQSQGGKTYVAREKWLLDSSIVVPQMGNVIVLPPEF